LSRIGYMILTSTASVAITPITTTFFSNMFLKVYFICTSVLKMLLIKFIYFLASKISFWLMSHLASSR